jgi:general nucleoside transport system permease protein
MTWAGFLGEATDLASASVRMAAPLAFAGLGEAWSERSGLLNIGLEAIMLCGAFAAFLVAGATGSPTLGVLAGAAGGVAVALLHAFVSIRCRADQTVAGLALNFLASGVTSFAFLRIYGKTTRLPSCPMLPVIPVPGLSDLPVVGPVLFRQSVLVYLAYAAVAVSWVLLARTEWGTRLQAAGENPRAADSVGLSVSRLRYLAAIANGCLGGIGGAFLTLAMLGFFMENVTSGRGYIALVVVILGRRHPLGVFLAALMLGAADALQFRVQTLGVPIPSQVFIMFPYVATVVVLLLSAGRSRAPAALGLPFDRRER